MRWVHSPELPKLSVEKLLLLLVLTLTLLLPVTITMVFVVHSYVVHCQQLRRFDAPFRLSLPTENFCFHIPFISSSQTSFASKATQSLAQEGQSNPGLLRRFACFPVNKLLATLQCCNMQSCNFSTSPGTARCPAPLIVGNNYHTQLLAG